MEDTKILMFIPDEGEASRLTKHTGAANLFEGALDLEIVVLIRFSVSFEGIYCIYGERTEEDLL
jgi:hypothetical protein